MQRRDRRHEGSESEGSEARRGGTSTDEAAAFARPLLSSLRRSGQGDQGSRLVEGRNERRRRDGCRWRKDGDEAE
eukprot:11025513-Alexandrium_andersonii.AAC.1